MAEAINDEINQSTPFLKFFIFLGGDPLDPPFAALALSIF